MSYNYNRTIRSTTTYSLSEELTNYTSSNTSDAWDVALDVAQEALDLIEDCGFFIDNDNDDIDDCTIYNM